MDVINSGSVKSVSSIPSTTSNASSRANSPTPQQQQPLDDISCFLCFGKCSYTLSTTKKNITKVSSNCFLYCSYSYGAASKSSVSSPCSNVPVSCQICKAVVFKYFMINHMKDKHGEENYDLKLDKNELMNLYNFKFKINKKRIGKYLVDKEKKKKKRKIIKIMVKMNEF